MLLQSKDLVNSFLPSLRFDQPLYFLGVPVFSLLFPERHDSEVLVVSFQAKFSHCQVWHLFRFSFVIDQILDLLPFPQLLLLVGATGSVLGINSKDDFPIPLSWEFIIKLHLFYLCLNLLKLAIPLFLRG